MGIRSASNSIGHVIAAYREQLAPLYSPGEVKAIVQAVFAQRLQRDALSLLLGAEDRLSESELLKVYLPLKRLRAGEPLQYVLGSAPFLGMDLQVAPGVLIPRPETEAMVEQLVRTSERQPRRVLDLGTGSGAIALALKKAWPAAEVVGMDLSSEALQQARANAERLQLQVEWRQQDMLDAAQPWPAADLVVSNPPYVLASEGPGLSVQVRYHEPGMALFVDDNDPLLFHRTIAQRAFALLPAGGALWMEGHRDHIATAVPLLRAMGWKEVELHRDIDGMDRCVSAER